MGYYVVSFSWRSHSKTDVTGPEDTKNHLMERLYLINGMDYGLEDGMDYGLEDGMGHAMEQLLVLCLDFFL